MSSKKLGFKIGETIASRYVIKGVIGEGGMGSVYRAMPFHGPSQDVAIKIIQQVRALRSDDILRFQKEAALMSLLHHPNIICFHELGILKTEYLSNQNTSHNPQDPEIGDGYYIVMEIADGKDLKNNLKNDSRKDLPFFFQVGLQVSSALDYTHGKNIIHGDIKPQNIMVGKTWQEQKGILVKVLDFGVARLAELTHSTSLDGQKSKEIAGTPLYMAPEQTPFMNNAPVDHRVDLYSLGCVLYEILTGRPPFVENSREKLMARHVKANPEPLRSIRPDVPKVIENVIMKLLAKHPNDRYQTAFGLHADLQRAKMTFLKTRGQKYFSFPLGLKDGFKAVSAQLKIVGRNKSFNELIKKYETVSSPHGRSHMVVIKGEAGIGKTRLLAELKAYLSSGRIRFISSNFSRHETNLPYNALANGFNEYLMALLKGQPHEAEELKRKIRTTLGSMAYIVAEKIPGLKPFIDVTFNPEPEIINSDVDSQELKNLNFQTFAAAFSDFTRCLSLDNQPIVFIFDDLHWADDNSLALVDQFFSHNNSQRFYLVAGYRTSALKVSPKLKNFVEKFKRLKRRYAEISLKKLNEGEIRELAGNMLNSYDSVNDDLVSFLATKTNGNPMYLVELLRALVAQEKVNYNNLTGKWDYNLTALKTEKIKLDSVDLTVNRIQTYVEEDRQVLEVASIIGMVFQYELLLLGENSKGPQARSALQKAIDEGLISRTTDDPDLKHLGKSYMFVHPRAREAILDTIVLEKKTSIHLQIAHFLDDAVKKPKKDSILFSIVHHINEAVTLNKNMQKDTAIFAIKYNISAGEKAAERSSWPQAKRYFEKSMSLINFFQLSQMSPDVLKVIERLADIESRLKNPKKATILYESLLSKSLPMAPFARVAKKINSIYIYGGEITKSIKLIQRTLKFLNLPQPKNSFPHKIMSHLRFFIDYWSAPLSRSRLYKLTQKAYQIGKTSLKKHKDIKTFDGPALLRQEFIVLLNEDPKIAFLCQDIILLECIRKVVSPDTILRSVADRAFLLGYFGQFKKSYSIIDISIDIAKSLGLDSTQGYIEQYKIFTLDHYLGKFEDFDKKIRDILPLLEDATDSFHHTYARIFLIHYDLLRGNLRRISRSIDFFYGQERSLPYKNWLSPRGLSAHMFSHFLRGNREILVFEGERYHLSLKQTNYRRNDLFVWIIRSLIASAKGEYHKAASFFRLLLEAFLLKDGGANKKPSPFLFPFEDDFICFYLSIFPELHIREHNRPLLGRGSTLLMHKYLLKKADLQVSRHRTVPKLIYANASAVLDKKNVKQRFDKAIRSASAANQILPLLVAYYWFGRYLLTTGHEGHIEYILKVQQESHSKGYKALSSLAEQTMLEFNIPFKKTAIKSDNLDTKSLDQTSLPPLTYRCLMQLVMDSHSTIVPEIEKYLSLLKNHYKNSAIYVLKSGESEVLTLINQIEISEEKEASLIAYVSPYINLRSTLFLPVSDCPWIEGENGISSISDVNSDAHDASSNPPLIDTHSTLIMHNTPRTMPHLTQSTKGHSQPEGDSLSNSKSPPKESFKKVPSQHSNVGMNLIVPIPFNKANLGVIFIERLQIKNGTNSIPRQDLDYFGSQLGLVIAGAQQKTTPYDLYKVRHGEYILEPCPWLDIWSEGNLRKGRDSTWFLGMNLGKHDYLLTYARINGPINPRSFISTSIWHHLLVLRSLMMASKRMSVALVEIKEEIIKVLSSFSLIKEVETISLAFTIFNKDSAFSYSGHFGPSRPLVLGGVNKVIPDNDLMFNLNNGRVVRYWGVTAELGVSSFYILPHDSSKLDSIEPGSMERNPKKSDNQTDLQQMLGKRLLRDNIPRYYVAACLKNEESLEDTLPRAL